MSTQTALSQPRRGTDLLAVLVRCALGAFFIYMGLGKALHPVEFLKLVREYELLQHYLLLNLVAASLPWVEVFCGVLLVMGIAVRGTAVVLLAMLLPFTMLVLLRALAIQGADSLPFCAVKFDCGCGAGEVLICRKLAENGLLIVSSIWLAFRQQMHLSLRHRIF
jgi:uncharacterized membrane protein YphA (DoxX/SURF4 family)